jgi:hypothetical protein
MNETAWQPIETAPKDGTRILVCQRMVRGEMVFRSVRITHWWFSFGRWNMTRGTPTHWMPLPDPPEPTP